MNTLQDIKQAITTLTASERAEVEWLLHEPSSPVILATKLPDQPARRRAVLGNKVLPNMVMGARDEAAA
jgi:hypothetical protein